MRIAATTALLALLVAAAAAAWFLPSMSGRVLDTRGRPLGGLRVVAVRLSAGERAWIRTTTADASGLFTVRFLLPGRYVVATESRNVTAGYGGEHELGWDDQATVSIAAGGTGALVQGTIVSHDGEPRRAHALMADTAQQRYFIASSDGQGRYSLKVPSGRYHAFAYAGGDVSRPRRFTIANSPVTQNLKMELAPTSAPRQVREWVKANAKVITTVDPGHGFADLEPLRALVEDARIVGLGEATHGTREFFRFKHRTFEFLVERMGFRLFAMEASMPDALPLNEYVLTGEGDPQTLIADLGFWTWDTAEVLDLVQWMRRYNTDPAHAQKLELWGFDMQAPDGAYFVLRRFLRCVDPEEAERLLAPLAPLSQPMVYWQSKGNVREAVAALAATFDARAVHYAKRSSEREVAIAKRMVELLRVGEEYARGGGMDGETRDRVMAENVVWILEHQPAHARMMLWAHNGHVQASDFDGTLPMGWHLRQRFGQDYRPIGFSFSRGRIRAKGIGRSGPHDFAVPPSDEKTIDAAFASAGVLRFFIDLRNARGPAADWFSARQRQRSVGAIFSPDAQKRYYRDLSPRESYDAMVYIEESTPPKAIERPLSGLGVGAAQPQPRNLAFEENPAGDQPAHWTTSLASQDAGYRASMTRNECATGQCVQLTRLEQRRRERGFGALAQRIDAKPYRGKRVRLRARVRSRLSGLHSMAQIWLRVDLPDRGVGFFDNMMTRPVRSQEHWTEVEITGRVDPKAEAIAFGPLLVGDGTAWFDDFQLELVP